MRSAFRVCEMAFGEIHPSRAFAPLAAESAVGIQVYAIHFPSGDQCGDPRTPATAYVAAAPCPTFRNLTELACLVLDTKLSTLPSGDQDGSVLSSFGSVKRVGWPTSAPSRSVASHTSEWRLFCASTTDPVVNAT
jgi:hypothetical protein